MPIDPTVALARLFSGVFFGWLALYFFRRARPDEPLRGSDSFPLRGRWLMCFVGVGALLASVWLVGWCLFVVVVLPGMMSCVFTPNGHAGFTVAKTPPRLEAWKRLGDHYFLRAVFLGLLLLGLRPHELSARSPDGALVARSYSPGMLVQLTSAITPSHFLRPLARHGALVQDIQTGERIKVFEEDQAEMNPFYARSTDSVRWRPDGGQVIFEESDGDSPGTFESVYRVTRRPPRVSE